MSDWLSDSRSREDTVRIPSIWLATVLSLVLHALVIWVWMPELQTLNVQAPEAVRPPDPLVVQIAPERRPQQRSQAVVPPPVAAAPPLRGLPPKPAARPPATPPPVPFNRPAPYSPPPPPVATPQPAPPPMEGDLASLIESRRRARGEAPQSAVPAPAEEPAPAVPQETEEERRRRIVAANLGTDRTPSFGGDPRTGGGIFQIERMGLNEAEFIFFGWNKDIKRNSRQRITVPKGDNPDIQIALVRRMIVIIREHEKGDFTWVSHRLGRNVTLSARAGDSAGLEDFLLREFFGNVR